MLDPSLLNERIEELEQGLKRRNVGLEVVSNVKSLSQRRKSLIKSVEALKAARNQGATLVAQLKAKAKTDALAGTQAEEKILENRKLGDEIKIADQELESVSEQLTELALHLPNIPHEGVPSGTSAEDNQLVKSWGTPRTISEPISDHVSLGLKHKILDFERAALLSGARFSLLMGAGAQLSRALAQFMLDHHTIKRGYQEVNPPLLVNRKTMTGTGNLPKFEQDLFKTQLEDKELFLIPTAEVSLTNIYADTIMDGSELPVRLTAHTACFRSEAGSYGKDVRGLIRQHQFEKVELVKFTKQEDSFQELEAMVQDAEAILEALELPYRRLLLCSGDMGFSATKTYDLEVWIPSQNTYREISSCSNCVDFQSRRAGIRYRDRPEDKPKFAHTLNGSGLAIGRTLVAVLENGQQADGSIGLPVALTPYLVKFLETTSNSKGPGRLEKRGEQIFIVS